MGDAQSAQREGKKDAATEESTKVDDDQPKENIEDKLLQNNGQISEINGKADDSIGAVNGDCEDEIAAEAILSPAEDISETEKPLTEEETPLGNFEINEMESTQKADDNEDVLQEMIQLDEKQNDINESFRRFFGTIGLKLTVKRGSGEIPPDMTDENNKDEPNRPEDIEDTANEPGIENAEQNYDNDSTTCPTLTDATSDDALEDAGEKTTETKVEEESFNAHADTTSHEGEEPHQDTPEEEPHLTPQSSCKEEVVASPLKRFFTTGIFSGMRKKKKSAEDETKTEKELVNMGKGEIEETTEQTGQQQDKDEIIQGVEAAVIETEHKEDELKEETQFPASAQTTDEGKPPTTDRSTIIVLDSEILNSQEKDKVQASPLRRLLSGSSLKKLSKKRRGSRSSDGKLSDSGEHVSDHLLSSTESAENQKEEGPAQPSVQAAREEDSAWTSFKKLLTPKRRIKRPSLTNDETEIPVTVEEPKPSEGEQISDHSTEEGKKRKDSSVSWEAVLCGSGKRRSRKTSDSEDETPQNDNCNKEDIGPKHSVESQQEISNENDILASSPKQAESPSEGDGESTWKSLKRLVTPKRKSKDEDESKENIKSDSELSQDESSFSIKRLLPGRKKRKSNEKPDHVSSDEADKDVPSEDEDSETPAVVPLSEFDTVETDVHIQTQADVESQIHEEGVNEVWKDLFDQMAEAVLPCDSMQTDATKVQDDDEALGKQISIIPATNEDPDELSESISKQQQLSDIPEEGIITETMATPASVPDEAARDDTIADDFIEITSEAITAPEPVDITLTDDTEMISAVSQLSSESSKTSGNTTPVPAEYDVKETDVLLQQVAETISTSPKAIQVYSEELSYDKISETCLNVEELDTVNALSATAQTESLSELNDSVSTEIISEVLTEEFNSAAEITLDEVHKVKVSHLEESVKELQSTYEEHHLVESVSEVDTDISPEGNKIVLDEGSTVAKIADETKDGAKEEQVQTLAEKEDQLMQHITDQIQAEENDELPKDQIQAEDKDELPKEEEELQEIAAGQAYSEEASVQSIEKEVISGNIPAAKTILYELKEESVVLTDVTTESEKKEELQTDPSEELEVVQSSTLDSEEGSVQSLERVTKDIPGVEIYELKEESVNAEPEKKEELQTDPTAVQAPEELEAVQASKLDSEECSVRLLEMDVISENIAEANTVVYEIKEESLLLTDVDTEPEKNEELQTAGNTEEVKPAEEFETLQASTLDLEEVRVPSLEMVIQDIPAVETAVNELKEERGKTEEVQPPEEFETLQASILDLEEARVQFLEKVIQDIPAVDEKVIQDIPAVETVVNELKEDSVFLTDVDTESEKTEELQTDQKAAETEEVCSPEEFEALQASTLDSEGSVQSLGKEVISENIPSAETAVTELQEESVLLTDVDTEPEQNEELQTAGKTEVQVQAPKEFETLQASILDSEGSFQSLEKEVISENIPAAETVVNELKEGSVLLTDVDTVNTVSSVETVSDEHKQETEVSVEPEEKIPVEAAKTELSITDESETKVVTQPDQTFEITEDQKTESIPQDHLVEQEDNITEVVDELKILTADHVSVNEEASYIQVIETTVFSEETPAPCVDDAAFTDEPKHKGNLCEGQENVEIEVERELPGTEIKTASVEYAVVEQLVTCNIKEVSAAIPDVLIEKTSSICEPLIEEVASEGVFKEENTSFTPSVRDDVDETAEEGVVVMVMQVPSVEFKENHRIQVQVVDFDIQSAETIVEEVIHVCHATVKVDNLSSTPEIEEELMIEEKKVVIKEVSQHVKENIPETVAESVVVNLEQDVTKQPDVVTEVSEFVESESNHSTGTPLYEVPTVISDNSATEQQMSEDLKQTPDLPETLEAQIHDQKEDLEETKAECEISELRVTAEEVKLSSEELNVKEINEQAQITEIAQSQSVTSSNTGLIVPQNTGMISSIGTVESPSSISLEFKLNIQFGQAKAPDCPQPTAERIETVKPTEMAEVGVQAVEVVEPVKLITPTQRAESQKEAELTKVVVWATEIIEPAANISTDSTEEVVTAKPIMLDVCTQAINTIELEEQILSTERVTSSVQATETIQLVMQSQQVLSVAFDQGEKAAEPVKQLEEETDQDVWMDAEEVIYTQGETEESHLEEAEPLKPHTESEQEEKVGLEQEVKMAPNPSTYEEESQQDMHKTDGQIGIESESEDFAVAPEHTDTASSSITSTEWD